MIVATSPTIKGKRITQYSGIVLGEAILGANMIWVRMASVFCILEAACHATCPAKQPR